MTKELGLGIGKFIFNTAIRRYDMLRSRDIIGCKESTYPLPARTSAFAERDLAPFLAAACADRRVAAINAMVDTEK